MKQSISLHKKYEDGYISPSKGRTNNFEYIYRNHNDQEIQKWVNYLNSKYFSVPEHEVSEHSEKYLIIRKSGIRIDNSVKYQFEHDFIANILLDGNLLESNTVHHINECRSDNSK